LEGVLVSSSSQQVTLFGNVLAFFAANRRLLMVRVA
jgi:hypothetical protein